MQPLTTEELTSHTLEGAVWPEIAQIALLVQENPQLLEYVRGTADSAALDTIRGSSVTRVVSLGTISGISVGVWLGMQIQASRQEVDEPDTGLQESASQGESELQV